jgi:mRNA-degrading endonuclease YafQ of YafQ-DinJ toxin-antitoxin module
MLGFRFTSQFKKDLKLMEKRRYNLGDIYDMIRREADHAESC